MRKAFLIIFAVLVIPAFTANLTTKQKYEIALQSIASQKNVLALEYKKAKTEQEKQITLNKAQVLFKNSFHKLFLFWENMPWTFNGNSYVPQQDTIACGPFVERMMHGLGCKYTRKIVCNAPMYSGKRVNIWQALSSEQVKAYCSKYLVKRNLSYKQKLELFYQELGTDKFYILGLTDHIAFAGPSLPGSKDSLTFFDSLIWVKQEPLSEMLHAPRTEVLWIGIMDREYIKKWMLQ